ncbi:DUF294 nucleotidyltransferase-like domain-containing protein [Halomonas urumqiensis]|uniref:Signal transduction protein n=1 Tax=Halomonas urumqiensis TaxID=1684789 RepID=A0A2N7UGM8_9GAMM|nr:DUF294 nucleotidyltransferase-like domain-containing protein [Halomonas urumqiensis]PMR79599.1 signal transduction protein [Halomonas urumqiensis]PTB01049.1 signal transduction protein [Halomonas urumqiensis]GHE22876.1 hypothetical protein GCM10017767_33970 [Halomonas urumqiensis]
MLVLYRASSWRQLFQCDFPPDASTLPPLLAPLRDALLELGREPTLAEAHRWQSTLVEALTRLDLPAWRISQLISDHNDWLYRRAIMLSLDEMQGLGWGKPPVEFCVLTLGSAGRHDSLMAPDQDNAMIIADYPDSRHTEIDGYFQSLGERFTDRLDAAGIPLCQGHVMARYPMWRKRLGEWQHQLTLWTAERRVKRVQQANILLDFHPVLGDARLAEALSSHVTELMPRAGLFLDEMGALLDEYPPALDRFGRLQGGGEDAPHDTAFNLKHQALLPLVSAIRLLALRHGVCAMETRARLTALVIKDALSIHQARSIEATLGRLQAYLLDEQRRSLKALRRIDGWVDLARLDEGERLMLRHDLRQIRALIRQAKANA